MSIAVPLSIPGAYAAAAFVEKRRAGKFERQGWSMVASFMICMPAVLLGLLAYAEGFRLTWTWSSSPLLLWEILTFLVLGATIISWKMSKPSEVGLATTSALLLTVLVANTLVLFVLIARATWLVDFISAVSLKGLLPACVLYCAWQVGKRATRQSQARQLRD